MDADRCVCCGRIIPEGRMVCPICETEAEEKMERLTMVRPNGIWKINGIPWKDISEGAVIDRATEQKLTHVLCRLKDYEETGITPDQLRQIDEAYQKLATELAGIRKRRKAETDRLLADLEYHADVYRYGKEHTDINAISTVKVLQEAIQYIREGGVRSRMAVKTKYFRGEECVHFHKSDDWDEIEGVINDASLADTDFDFKYQTDETAKEAYENLPWTEAIVVHIGLPEIPE